MAKEAGREPGKGVLSWNLGGESDGKQGQESGPLYQMLLRYASNLLLLFFCQITYLNSIQHAPVRAKGSGSSGSREGGQEGCCDPS